nr:unnamed protein product [Digitaria exilis]
MERERGRSAAAEEWNIDATHAAALLRAAAAVSIYWPGLQRRRGGPWEKTNRTADSVMAGDDGARVRHRKRGRAGCPTASFSFVGGASTLSPASLMPVPFLVLRPDLRPWDEASSSIPPPCL